MDDIFASLTGFAKFNKTKNQESIRAFSGKAIHSASESILDAANPKSSSGKRKAESAANIDDDDSEGDSGSDEEAFDAEREDEVNAFRNRLSIHVKGNDIPVPSATFQAMQMCPDVKKVIVDNIEKTDWKEPTAIQMQAVPAMLMGRDVLAAAPTGSGKTAAFVIPVLSRVAELQIDESKRKNKKRKKEKEGMSDASEDTTRKSGIRALIMAPTKELAEQIHREATRLATGKKMKISLLNKNKATLALSQRGKAVFDGVDVLVATPLRLLSLVRQRAIDLTGVRIAVLDEVDKLFDSESGRGDDEGGQLHASDDDESKDGKETETKFGGTQATSSFLTQVDEILDQCDSERLQKALFSATIGPHVQELANGLLKNNVRVSIGRENTGSSNIDQRLVFVGREEGKLLAMRQLIQKGLRPPVLIFLQSKERAKELFLELVYDGVNVDVIHAERTQQQREDCIRRFRTGEVWVLICTDLLARGVDFKGVKMVINYDLPQSAVAYIHRIGRTGRAGEKGTAVTFFTEEDMSRLRPIANVVKLSGCEVPEWMLSIKKLKTKEKRQLRKIAPKRQTIKTDTLYDKRKRSKKQSMITHSKKSKSSV